MAKIDLDAMSIEEVADLRDLATDKLAEKVAARRAELEAELEKLAQYDKPARKSQVAVATAKPKKSQESGAPEVAKKADEIKEPVAKAA
ncbi:MAG: hypothetical protein JWR80_4632 [Bradyrhizobium sp.]|nr:hypothetical protein [Bradyrhizobium sp.]